MAQVERHIVLALRDQNHLTSERVGDSGFI
jgi:hypothetical protein